jgi:hypothetical protein
MGINNYKAVQWHFYGMVKKLTLSPLKKAIKSKNRNQFESTLYSNWRQRHASVGTGITATGF